MTTLTKRLENSIDRIGLDQADVARIVDASARTIARWVHEDVQPRRPARERLLELLAALERLAGVLRPEPARDWLFTPNPLLGHEKPAELLRQGRYREVLGAIDQLGEGVFV